MRSAGRIAIGNRGRNPARRALRGTVLAAALLAGCGKAAGPPSPEVTSLGTVEVTARLAEVLGRFMPNDNYDYVHVMKYEVLEVHRGSVDGRKTIFVGHYDPLKPRARAADKFVKVGGNVERFRVGDVHRLALEAPLEEHYMGGIIDKHIQEEGTRYLALWADRE